MSFWSGLFSKKQSNSYIVVIEFSSASVEIALVLTSDKPRIIHNLRVDYHNHPSSGVKDMIKLANKTLDSVLSQMWIKSQDERKRYNADILSGVYVFLSSPWYLSQSKNIGLKNIKGGLLDYSLAKGVVSDEEIIFEKNVEKLQTKREFIPLEKHIQDIRVNGYTIEKLPVKCNEAEVLAHFAICDRELKEEIDSTINRHFHRHAIFRSFPLSCKLFLDQFIPKIGQVLVIDLRYLTTDLTLLRDGMLVETVTFADGVKNIVEAVSLKTGLEPELARSALRVWSEGKTDSELNVEISDISIKSFDLWAEKLAKSLGELHMMRGNISKILLITSKDFLKEATSALQRISKIIASEIGRSEHIKVEDELSRLLTIDPHLNPSRFLQISSIAAFVMHLQTLRK